MAHGASLLGGHRAMNIRQPVEKAVQLILIVTNCPQSYFDKVGVRTRRYFVFIPLEMRKWISLISLISIRPFHDQPNVHLCEMVGFIT